MNDVNVDTEQMFSKSISNLLRPISVHHNSDYNETIQAMHRPTVTKTVIFMNTGDNYL